MNTTDNTNPPMAIDFDSVSQSPQGQDAQRMLLEMLRSAEAVDDVMRQARERFADVPWSKLGFGADAWFQTYVVCNAIERIEAAKRGTEFKPVPTAPRPKLPWYRRLFGATRANAST